jgi:hypothetical protein
VPKDPSEFLSVLKQLLQITQQLLSADLAMQEVLLTEREHLIESLSGRQYSEAEKALAEGILQDITRLEASILKSLESQQASTLKAASILSIHKNQLGHYQLQPSTETFGINS